jgi:hypothetical protein
MEQTVVFRGNMVFFIHQPEGEADQDLKLVK